MVDDKTEFTYPAWVNEEFFQDVLVKDVPDYVKIIKFKPTSALPPGGNFASVMIRIHFELELKDGSVKQKSYLLKTMLDDDKGGNEIKEMSLFPKEVEFYKTYLPAFMKLYKDANWDIQIAPRCLKHKVSNECSYLVFEDLKEKEYVNVNRLHGMDMPHMIQTLRKLAEFHAASAVYEELHGPYPTEFHIGFGGTEEQDEFRKKFFNSKVDTFKEAVHNWELDDEMVKKILDKFPTYEQYKKCSLRTSDTKNNVFNVLTHGDFWSSNVMQNYHSNGDIKDLLLVDFQFLKWGSPAEDLLFYITISAANDVRMKEYEHFVAIYHERLIECLKVLKYKQRLPKLREMQMEMYKEQPGFYAFFAVFNHLPTVLLPSTKKSNFETLMSDNKEAMDFRLSIYTSPSFVSVIKELYPFYLRRGVFDFEDYE